MKMFLIPRKDHEVYFIPIPERIKNKLIHSFAAEQLDKLHPGFSDTIVFDLRQLAFSGRRWIMATVMNADTLAEYEILYKGAALFTNTSIAVSQKGFSGSGINIIGDEQIGFDSEKNEPVSIPLETKYAGITCNEKEIKKIPARYGVFKRKIDRQYLTAVTAFSFLTVLVSCILFVSTKSTDDIVPFETSAEPVIPVTVPDIKYLPSATEILAKISADIVEAGGKMTDWQYSEESEPFIKILLQGVDVLMAYRICNQYEYACLQDIRNVVYTGEEPTVTINMNAVKAGYTRLKAGAFSAQNSTLPMIADLSNFLRRQEINIVSEELPASDNGYFFYTVTYTAKDWNLVRSLEIIADTCDKYLLRIKKMDISIGNNRNNFTVICSLAQCHTPVPAFIKQDGGLEIIPQAFGYEEVVLATNSREGMEFEAVPEPPLLGTISDESGQMVFYRDISTGKILIRGTDG